MSQIINYILLSLQSLKNLNVHRCRVRFTLQFKLITKWEKNLKVNTNCLSPQISKSAEIKHLKS